MYSRRKWFWFFIRFNRVRKAWRLAKKTYNEHKDKSDKIKEVEVLINSGITEHEILKD